MVCPWLIKGYGCKFNGGFHGCFSIGDKICVCKHLWDGFAEGFEGAAFAFRGLTKRKQAR
jgi:hypothetical protein